jgi:aminoglycoside 2'-N-acetyltransferase I
MAALEDVVRGAYDLGALSATDDGAALYRARGWQPWRGSTWARTPSGRIRTPQDDDAVFVLPAGAALDLAGELTCDWRDGDLW